MAIEVNEHGLEVLKKAGEYVTPGDNTKTTLRVKSTPDGFEPPAGAALIEAEDSTDSGYYITIFRYYDGGTPGAPGTLLGARTFYFTDTDRCEFAWAMIGEP